MLARRAYLGLVRDLVHGYEAYAERAGGSAPVFCPFGATGHISQPIEIDLAEDSIIADYESVVPHIESYFRRAGIACVVFRVVCILDEFMS